jgi:hypothetical protein
MSIPFLPIHPHPQRLMSKTYRRRLRRQQAGVRAPQGGPDFVSLEDQFRMSLDTFTPSMAFCSSSVVPWAAHPDSEQHLRQLVPLGKCSIPRQ